MAHRIAINGYGRIGQCVLRALYENRYRQHLQVVAINELADPETIAYLTRFDTTHGYFPAQVRQENNSLVVNGDQIRLLNHPEPKNLPWEALGIDLVLECTGSYTDRETAEVHLQSGAKRLLFSQPAESTVDATIVYGINEVQLKPFHRIVSNASCTTNCIVPVLKTLDDHFGIEHGTITTIHSAMNDQPVIDAYHHTDLRLTRSAMQSIIPRDTGLAKGIDRLMPHLAGCFAALSMRVPTINVSAMDLTVQVKRTTTVAEINEMIRQTARGPLRGLMRYVEEPLVSCDFNHDSHSSIVDLTQTKVIRGQMVKMVTWFDNEWGFANRMLDVSLHWLKQMA
ncbi:type I glyceraldehyde-3-phosphate dehydrogenase [Zooshikella marina]|uniref:Glyceraldehyde-3-phosphate dehydrogenase n=1 Tax=Zooshikella ganghwensis TaxID=202772 RepID=A0A4P9VR46_9GAMM|nr:type I glyceraldehyde-3-phosphate dehydrogenase [Zooshikella ganghwensis]MBU2707793.1 type I glyceraldehyde-3-phosphate dehydrogenase [Zooshikella ganghwensis]RDH46055.1 type I glyceraldehyde-3-phosphate dehydrogenase [Zooshikella ganghwensis]